MELPDGGGSWCLCSVVLLACLLGLLAGRRLAGVVRVQAGLAGLAGLGWAF